MIDLIKANRLTQTQKFNLLKVHTLDNHLIFISDSYQFEFLGDTYEAVDMSIDGVGVAEGGEEVRPTWKIGNPNAYLHQTALSGTLEGAIITHYQIQVPTENLAEFETLAVYVWQLYQVVSVNTELVLQLRTLTDIPSAQVPHRGYYPPEFPHGSV